MSTTLMVPPRIRSRAILQQRQRDADEEHTPEYTALLHALLRSTHALIDALKSDSTEPASLRGAVAQYVARALQAGISRARIREALELLVHEHGGPRWLGAATAIASLATGTPAAS